MKKVKDLKTYYFECGCHVQDHAFGVAFDVNDKEMFIFNQLDSNANFFKRLLYGIKYILGIRPQYGHWEETILGEEKFMELFSLMTRFYHTAGFTNKGAIKIQKALDDIAKGNPNSVVPTGTHVQQDLTPKLKLKK